VLGKPIQGSQCQNQGVTYQEHGDPGRKRVFLHNEPILLESLKRGKRILFIMEVSRFIDPLQWQKKTVRIHQEVSRKNPCVKNS
jgi:hypothetical protein